MAWTTIVLVSTGELATAAVQNTQVLGNLNELRQGGIALPSQAALDFAYPSSASQWARIAGAARKGPRLNDAGTAYVMTTMEQHYTPTVADVANTAVETTTLSFSVAANEMADGDVIEMVAAVKAKNNKGSGGTVVVNGYWGATTVALSSDTWDDNASERLILMRLYMMRVGSDLWWRKRFSGSSQDSDFNMGFTNIPAGGDNAIVMSAPTFNSTQTVAVKILLDAANANYYFKTQKARVWRIPAA